ncbi:nucleoside:proton symporter, partial [Achromatium sp. WMS2]
MWWQSLIGLCVIPILAWVISEDRSKIQPRLVITGIAMQIALAILLLKFPLFHNIFIPINQANTAISKAATAGTSFVFGFLGGGPQPFTITNPSAGLILAFQVLPLV